MEAEDRYEHRQKADLAILEEGQVILCPDRTKCAECMKKSVIDGTHWIATADIRGFRVATVFLGIDHNVAGIGSPQWFETTVSRSSVDDNSLPVKIEGETFRYPTLADALAGHVVICEKVKSSREIGE